MLSAWIPFCKDRATASKDELDLDTCEPRIKKKWASKRHESLMIEISSVQQTMPIYLDSFALALRTSVTRLLMGASGGHFPG